MDRTERVQCWVAAIGITVAVVAIRTLTTVQFESGQIDFTTFCMNLVFTFGIGTLSTFPICALIEDWERRKSLDTPA